MILDIKLKVVVEIGRARIPIREILRFSQGSVVELSKLASEPMDVYVNNKLIARAEAVVVHEKFGVRLTEVLSKSELIENLR